MVMSDYELEQRIDALSSWIEEGRKFPNNYRNVQYISTIAADLVNDLVNERFGLIKEITKLRKLREHDQRHR